MLAIVITLILGVGAIAWLLSSRWRKTLHRRRITAKPFPKEWRNILKKRLPYFHALPTDLQLQLKRHIQIFIDEKEFVGCDDFEITDEVKVTIAAQACLLLLNRKTDFYPKLKQILVYPDAFIVNNQHRDTSGVVWEQRNVLAGESWEYGKVVLSWKNTLDGAADPHDGNNVVIHEFAHQLDQEDGQANGAPILQHYADYSTWSEVLSKAFNQLQHSANDGTPSIFNYYGATNPAEFFAVITEVFFEKPEDFYQQHPDLYRELSRFYQLDPINWH
ncbi:MAG: zinc-dependent peptidase [Gammaproteobacteria bacterium]|nr:zinc-dependent peptidase [Gammaproteobacteria bacterium]MBU1478345.1 zinc-dependent peptidase [Gammaproteobacteria bacterium]MBU2003409.1 zinc-dependent peptidase [Gammaproteobacteria bacterium]MBU2131457.1 zinc-dependent peptidase [Gammaproteobacteria bacterium]MBU2185660.1 zinc-dependent peptidase [Gammaproteobacteria bacterium]